CGKGEFSGVGTAEETAIQHAIFTRKGTERIIRYAFDYAQKHGKNKVLSATKSNALNYSMVFWDKVFNKSQLSDNGSDSNAR
ncbi:MAG: isocitrate/isopropylmalate family dehydrogenase, partial [Victivallaceae bacterium]|nr:isocitrate/isopropylmalate family dehydrogenase [Victivallaceae bacterium]